MAARRSFGPGPKIKQAIIGSQLWPQLPSNTPVTADTFNSVFTKGRSADSPPQVYALWISTSRLKNNARSLAQVDKEIVTGRDVGQLHRLLQANFYRRRCVANLSDGRPCSAMVYKRMVSRRDKRVTLGYFCIVYEAPAPAKRGGGIRDEKAHDQKEERTAVRRSCEFGEWLTHFIGGAHEDRAFTELSLHYKPNGGDSKLPDDEIESWGPTFWKIRDINEYARAVSDYTTLEFTAGNIKSHMFLDDPEHILCPLNVFSAGTAVDAYKRDVERDLSGASAAAADDELDGDAADNAVDDVPNFAWIQNHIENTAYVRAKGVVPPDQSWTISHDQAHPSIIDTFQMPHIKAEVDTSSASFISFFASRNSAMTIEQAAQQYQRLHAPTVQRYGDMEAFRIEMVSRVNRVTDTKERIEVRRTGLDLFKSVWSNDCDYSGGSLEGVIAYGIEKNNKKQSMSTLMTVTDQNTDILGQKYQRLMQGFETLFGTNSMHYALLISLLAQLTASNDNDEENIITLLTGPAGASKSYVQKVAMAIAIPKTTEPISHSTAMADTTETSSQAHIRVYDESSAAQFGVPEGNRSQWELVQRVLGNRSTGAGGEGLKVFKTAATSRSMITKSIDLSTGRRLQVRVATTIYGSRSYAINIELPELPDTVINRAVVIDFTEATRDDGKDIFNARANVSNAGARSMARLRYVEEYRNDMFLITRQNQLTACGSIVMPVNLKISGQLADVVTRNLIEGFYGKKMRRSREIGKINKLVTAAVQQRATALVFELGIGGPDPSRTFNDEDSLLTMPFNVSTISTVVFMFELLRLFVNDAETEIVKHMREHFFKDYFEKEQLYLDAHPGYVKKGNEPHPMEKTLNPNYHGKQIKEKCGYLIIENVFSDDDFMDEKAASVAASATTTKSAKPQSADKMEADSAAMGLTNCLKRILQSFHSSMKSAPTEDSALAVLANLLNPRIQPQFAGEKIQSPMRIHNKRGALIFHKETLTAAHHDVVWNLLQGILEDSDTGGQTFIRGRTEGDYFTFLKGKLGRDGSVAASSSSAAAAASAPQVASSQSDDQEAADLAAMEAVDAKASGVDVKSSSIPLKPVKGLVPGSRKGKLITEITNPEYCNPEQIDRMIRSGLITVAESKTFSGQQFIKTQLISDEQAIREHLTEIRNAYGGAFWKIGEDLTEHYAMPANLRCIMEVIYQWHSICNRFKLAVYHLKTAKSACEAKYQTEYDTCGRDLLTHFNHYFTVLDKYSALRENISPGWIEKWLVHFEIRLTHKVKRKALRGTAERIHEVDSIRDAIYQYCQTNIQIIRSTATLKREKAKLERYRTGELKIENVAVHAADQKRVEHIVKELSDSKADLIRIQQEYVKGLGDWKRFHCESAPQVPASSLKRAGEDLRQAIASDDSLGAAPSPSHVDSKHSAAAHRPTKSTPPPVPMADSPGREDEIAMQEMEDCDHQAMAQQDQDAMDEWDKIQAVRSAEPEKALSMAERLAADAAEAAAAAVKAASELGAEATRMLTETERLAAAKARYKPVPVEDTKVSTVDSVPLAFGGTEIKELKAALPSAPKALRPESLVEKSTEPEKTSEPAASKKKRKRGTGRKKSEFVDDAASGSDKDSDESDGSEVEADKQFVLGSDEDEAPKHRAHKHARRETHKPTPEEEHEMLELQAEKDRFRALKKAGRKAKKKAKAAARAAAEAEILGEASAAGAAVIDTVLESGGAEDEPKRKLKRLRRMDLSDDEEPDADEEKKRQALQEAIEEASIAERDVLNRKYAASVIAEERALGVDDEENREIEGEA